MLIEKVIGTLDSGEKRTIDYVDIEWHEAFKKIHKKTTQAGEEIGIRLDNQILTRGLRQGDVLYEDSNRVIAVRIPACEAMVIRIKPDHEKAIAQVCYEVGNTHGTLFWGNEGNEFFTPINDPLMEKLQKMHGVEVEKKQVIFDFDKAISSSINNHHH
ncbi:MAG: urease accessory protein UreE [Lachnospiraceae bacterium]|nr:urease accessory protein UreE [Lachnospiraceae bacterium]MDD3615768.1 urease accessory protein UreE [Lachnospiraceae bacterium]